MAQTFAQRPSTIARDLLGAELDTITTPLDWYAFDVAAARRYFDMRHAADQQVQTDADRPKRRAPSPLPDAPDANGVILQGSEIPPWERMR